MPASRPRVAIERVHDDQLDLALEQLLAWLGPPASLIPAGSRVLIKPNLTISPTILGITRTELVEALVRWIVRQTDAADVAIGEGSGDVYTSQAFRLEGYRRIAARYGVRLVDLNVEPAVRVEVPPELGRDHVMVPRAAAEADVLISLPIWKLWGNAPLSLSLKNHFGLYGGRYYGHNKHSRELAPQHPHYGLPGDIGDERGIHAPTTNQAIAAVNLAAPIHLAIIDALEASDGRGHYLRWDTLVAGTNAVATDAVGMAMAGYVPQEQEVLQLCNAHGLGPARLDAIELLGLPLDEVSFDLKRLREGVREMPLAYCLRLLSALELAQIGRALPLYGLAEADALPDPHAEEPVKSAWIDALMPILSAPGYYRAAIEAIAPTARDLLRLWSEHGGTSGDLAELRERFTRERAMDESLVYAPAARELTRLGLATIVRGSAHDYVLLPEGLSEAL